VIGSQVALADGTLANAGGMVAASDTGYTTWNYSLLTTVAYFGLHVNSADGHISHSTGDTGWTVWNSADVQDMIGRAHAAGARVVVTIISQPSAASECTALQHASTTVSDTLVEVNAKGVDGVNVDYESGNASCGSSSNRALLAGLVHSLRAALGGRNLTVDTYAGSAGDASGYGFFDIWGMAADVDGFFVMAYDLDGDATGGNWQSAPLGCPRYCLSPNSPISGYAYNDTRVVNEYFNAVGHGKTILGLPYYGYTACVDSPVHNALPSAVPNWGTPRYADAASVAGDPAYAPYESHRDFFNGSDRWDTFSNATYHCTRESYWNDATSLAAKYDLVRQRGLRGAGIFSLDYGGGAPELWDALATHFTNRPGAPGGVSAGQGDGFATVSWTPPPSASPLTGYSVIATAGATPAGTRLVGGAASFLNFPGLSNGTAYTFTVVATNAAGPGPASAASNSVTPYTTPGAPTGAAATAGSSQATVTWTAPASNGGSAISGYTVPSPPDNKTATGHGSPLSGTLTGLTPGTS